MKRETGDFQPACAPTRKIRVKLFDLADRCFSRAVEVLRAVHEGCWLGCLSADDLNTITNGHYGKSRHYASTDHNLSGFLNWEKPVLDQYFRRGSRILVAAAGAGREVLALRKAGFEADGFECNPTLLRASQEIADRLGGLPHVVPSTPDSVPPGSAVYDGLIVGWGGYTHIPTRRRRLIFLQALRQRAQPNSPLLISFLTRGESSPYETVCYRTARFSRFLLRGRKDHTEPGDHLEWGRYVHRFDRDEIEDELTSAGFQVVYYNQDTDYPHAVATTG